MVINPLCTETHVYHEVGCDKTILLTLGRVYWGKKINGQNPYCFNSFMSFCSCLNSINNEDNE